MIIIRIFRRKLFIRFKSVFLSFLVGLDGKEYICDNYELLLTYEGSQVIWKQSSHGRIHEDAVEGGKTISGETLYIGRVIHNQMKVPGKIQPSKKRMFITSNFVEIAIEEYEILIIK